MNWTWECFIWSDRKCSESPSEVLIRKLDNASVSKEGGLLLLNLKDSRKAAAQRGGQSPWARRLELVSLAVDAPHCPGTHPSSWCKAGWQQRCPRHQENVGARTLGKGQAHGVFYIHACQYGSQMDMMQWTWSNGFPRASGGSAGWRSSRSSETHRLGDSWALPLTSCTTLSMTNPGSAHITERHLEEGLDHGGWWMSVSNHGCDHHQHHHLSGTCTAWDTADLHHGHCRWRQREGRQLHLEE